MATVRIHKEVEFDSGHRVPSHGSKCKHPHGHRYRIRAVCEGPIIDDPGSPDDGMLVDFGDLKVLLNALVHDVLDHGFIVHKDDTALLELLMELPEPESVGHPLAPPTQAATLRPKHGWNVIVFPYVPTAENIARWAFEQLEVPVRARFREGLALKEIVIWETPTSVAYYQGL
jgi:6-pyruvoyltetrahydropterin/6-carboxytetrahydropterin synthase